MKLLGQVSLYVVRSIKLRYRYENQNYMEIYSAISTKFEYRVLVLNMLMMNWITSTLLKYTAFVPSFTAEHITNYNLNRLQNGTGKLAENQWFTLRYISEWDWNEFN